MTSYEVQKAIREQRRPDQQFIKWWRKEEDFLDFDLLDRFMANLDDAQVIDGFDLVGIDDMWGYVQRVAGDKVERVVKNGVETILWADKDRLVTKEVPFTPESLIDIFDAETDDNFVDS